jgi:hypothetical protein
LAPIAAPRQAATVLAVMRTLYIEVNKRSWLAGGRVMGL